MLIIFSSIEIGANFPWKKIQTESRIYLIISPGFLLVLSSTISEGLNPDTAFSAANKAGIAASKSFTAEALSLAIVSA